jgi:long-subunit fatty acid transport protein
MSLRIFSAAMVIVFILIITSNVSNADEFHYTNMLIGDRATGMGGAYTGVSDDPSGLYYNPAGIVYTTGRNLSASVNAYYNISKDYKSVIGGNGWKREATSILPNFFGIVQPIGKFKFGFSYAVPNSIKEDQDQTFWGSIPTTLGSPATRYTINFNNEDNTFLVGPSIAAELTSSLSAGLTLYMYHRSNQSILNQFIQLQDGRFEWSNQYIEKVERGYKPVVGIMWTPVEKLSIGISLAKIFVYSSSMMSQSTIKDANAPTPNDVTITEIGDSSNKNYPYELRVGAGYFSSSSLLVSADAAYYTKVTDPVNGDRVSVMNLAVGTEYFLNRNWAVRGGLYSDLANTPKLDPTRTNQDEKIDLYGMSLSISNFSRNTSITLGGSMTTGSGKAQILSGSSEIQNVDQAGWMMFLSSSYSY